MAENGWIRLHRQLQDCFLWNGERFSKGQAWVDLLLLANHKDKEILFGGEKITIKRGQHLTSSVRLAEKWKWDRKTVTAFLKLLEKENMIVRLADNKKTLITIKNYELYQGFEEEDVQRNSHQYVQQLDNTVDTNNNENNDKNEKNIILSEVQSSTCKNEDVKKVLDSWNELKACGIKTVGKLKSGTQRYKMLQSRIAEYGIGDVLAAIENIKSSSFLQGKHSGKPWQITFDWFVRPNNFPKVLDGNYNDNTRGDNYGKVGRNDENDEKGGYTDTFYEAIIG